MLRLEEIKERLRDRNAEAVAAMVGVHANTIRAIRNGDNQNPRYSIVKALSEYLTNESH